MTLPVASTQQVVQFEDDVPHQGEQVASYPDSTYSAGTTPAISLAQFFERPIVAYRQTWEVGGNIFADFNPWSLYFNNPRVVNRIANYKLLRCNLHVKAVVNGTPFHYGRLLVSYTPLFGTNTLGPENRALVAQDAIAESQRPHFFVNPTTSEGGQLDLPFFFPYNAVDIVSAEWDKLGSIFVRGFNQLEHANGGLDPVSVTFFVWASDVHLSVPTTFEPSSIVPQSDEYGSQPISKPAAAIANAASLFKKVPIIGPYARATCMAAGGVGEIARIFGMSKPTHCDGGDAANLRSGTLANTIGVDMSQKLSLDPKQEVTIDPRTTGLSSTDEMAFQNLATRESYLTTFKWYADTAPDVQLWNGLVTPTLFDYNADEIHMTPMCWIAQAFQYWRGTIKFRFQVVASAMHRGRLRVKYEPNTSESMPGLEYNVAFSRIVDIGEESDFTIEVGWGQQSSYLQVNSIGARPFGAAPITATDGTVNGVIQVFPVTQLVSPSTAGQEISINVFVSAGDDFEVMGPWDANIRGLTWILPDEIIPQSINQPTQNESISLGLDVSNFDPHHMVYHGDPVVSWRQCLKRYCFHSVTCVGDGALTEARKLLTHSLAAFPNYRGCDPTGLVTTPGGRVNYSMMTILNYVVPAYLGFRGGIRWKLHWRQNNTADMFNVSRSPAISSYALVESPSARDEMDFWAANGIFDVWSGSMLTSGQYNPIAEFELPYYSNKRFYNARNGRINTAYEGDFFTTSLYTAGSGSLETMNYVSGSEDFSTFFFLNVPVCWKQTVLPDR